MIDNSAPLNISGHPAISVPCGLGEGECPIGLMLVGRHFDKLTVYPAAHAYKQSVDWQTLGVRE